MLAVSFTIYHTRPVRVVATIVRGDDRPAVITVSTDKQVKYAIMWSARSAPEPRERLTSPVRWVADDKSGIVLEIVEKTRLYVYVDGDAKIFDLCPELNTVEIFRV